MSAEDKYGILHLGIFGSAARGQMNENSDIDVCVELKTPDPFIIVHIKQELEEQFHKSVDIIRIREKMNPYLKRRIEKEAMFEDIRFEWDKDKADRNLKKHKVSFDEAVTVFNDAFIASIPDPDHSEDEQRYIGIGVSVKKRMLAVVYTERRDRIRIISCRKATTNERRAYEESNF